MARWNNVSQFLENQLKPQLQWYHIHIGNLIFTSQNIKHIQNIYQDFMCFIRLLTEDSSGHLHCRTHNHIGATFNSTMGFQMFPQIVSAQNDAMSHWRFLRLSADKQIQVFLGLILHISKLALYVSNHLLLLDFWVFTFPPNDRCAGTKGRWLQPT